MARVPIEEGFFRIPDDPAEPPRLLGSRCPTCGEVFFPRRHGVRAVPARGHRRRRAVDPRDALDVDVLPRADVREEGRRRAGLRRRPGRPAEGPRVQSILLGGPDDFEIGMELEIDLETLRENRDGDEIVIYRFRPVGGGGDA